VLHNPKIKMSGIQVYQHSQIGRALCYALQEMVDSDLLTEDQAEQIMRAFDQSIALAIPNNPDSDFSVEIHVSFFFCDR
jgi:hypothetical protein